MVKSVNLRNSNLNLLPILRELLNRRSVTETAKTLNLTQSAVSASLKRLRSMFDDDLLVPSGREMVLTETGQKMLPKVNDLLTAITDFFGEMPFDPATADNRFRVATADYVTALLAPHLGKVLQDSAPHIKFQVTAETNFISKFLRMGAFDMVIAPEKIETWSLLNYKDGTSDLCYEPCFSDQLVAIQSADRDDGDGMDLTTYLSRTHVSFYFRDGLHASIEQECLTSLGLRQNDRVLVPEFSLLPHLVVCNDAISVIPASLAKHFAQIYPIKAFKPPIDFPPLELVMIWSKLRNRDPALSWFRSLVKEGFNAVK